MRSFVCAPLNSGRCTGCGRSPGSLRRSSASHRQYLAGIRGGGLAAHAPGRVLGRCLERAAPTDQLIRFARRTLGAMWVQCFPLPSIDAEEALRLAAGRSPSDLVWSAAAARERSAAAFCYADRR
jgi:hypothetical protein